MWNTTCLWCGSYHVAWGDNPTPFCDTCLEEGRDVQWHEEENAECDTKIHASFLFDVDKHFGDRIFQVVSWVERSRRRPLGRRTRELLGELLERPAACLPMHLIFEGDERFAFVLGNPHFVVPDSTIVDAAQEARFIHRYSGLTLAKIEHLQQINDAYLVLLGHVPWQAAFGSRHECLEFTRRHSDLVPLGMGHAKHRIDALVVIAQREADLVPRETRLFARYQLLYMFSLGVAEADEVPVLSSLLEAERINTPEFQIAELRRRIARMDGNEEDGSKYQLALFDELDTAPAWHRFYEFPAKKAEVLPRDPRTAHDERDPEALAVSPGGGYWVLDTHSAMELLEGYKGLSVREGWTLVTVKYREGDNGHGLTWAVPAASVSKLEGSLERAGYRSLPDFEEKEPAFMRAIVGPDTPWSYVCASMFARAASEIGARWHGASWGWHHLMGTRPTEDLGWVLESADKKGWAWQTGWTGEPGQKVPWDWNFQVVMADREVEVIFYTHNTLGQETIVQHRDRYERGTYHFETESTVIAVGPGLCVP